jgi:hypothetical protein
VKASGAAADRGCARGGSTVGNIPPTSAARSVTRVCLFQEAWFYLFYFKRPGFISKEPYKKTVRVLHPRNPHRSLTLTTQSKRLRTQAPCRRCARRHGLLSVSARTAATVRAVRNGSLAARPGGARAA